MTDLAALLERTVVDVPDFPEPGVVFKDLTPLMDDHDAFAAVVDALAAGGRDSAGALVVDKVVGIEARGFIFAAPVALALGIGFVPVRKPGKLPRATESVTYALEYGTDTLEMHSDALSNGDRVLLVDDVLATGGTARAAADLVERGGGSVASMAVILELSFLHGRERIEGLDLQALRTI